MSWGWRYSVKCSGVKRINRREMSVISVDVALKQEPGANLGLVCSCKAFMQPNKKERKGEYESKTC